MYHGIINIYKEKGFTSHDVVAKLRGILKQKKIGHTGTLDPDATGVLPVCLGKATKLCDMLTEKKKAYRAKMILGKATDTQDISGVVINATDIDGLRDNISDEYIKSVIMSFVGEYSQIPPMYSAIKVNGKRLYELAREGIEIERKSREVIIYKIEIISISYPEIEMEVTCSKGTYIRTLCNDIGEKLNTFGCMTELQRIQSGDFFLENAKTLSKVEELVATGEFEAELIPVDYMFRAYEKINVPETLNKLLYNGNPIPVWSELSLEHMEDGIQVRVYDVTDEFMGIYKFQENCKLLKPEKLFLN